MTIEDYFLKTEQIISNFDIIIKQETEKKKTDDNFGIFKGVFYFEYGRLDFIEVIRIVSGIPIKTKYKYHFIKGDKMLFRYDNVKHHPNISTFPHHKHIPGDIIPSKEPNFEVILNEIYRIGFNFEKEQ
jgi:hypothetical protein